jgi:hypothetical protein
VPGTVVAPVDLDVTSERILVRANALRRAEYDQSPDLRTVAAARRIAVAPPEISLFGDKIPCSGAGNSLFCILQGIARKILISLSISASAAPKSAKNGRKLSKYPVKFPVLREIAAIIGRLPSSLDRDDVDRGGEALLARGQHDAVERGDIGVVAPDREHDVIFAGELASALPVSPSREHLNGVAFWERKPARGPPVDLPEAAPTGAEREESAGVRDERASRHIAFGRVR